MTEIQHRVAVAQKIVANLRAFLATLNAEQWTGQSACAEWQVRDVVSHLIGGAERQTQSMERGRAGESGPPPGFVPPSPAELSAANAQRDIQRRGELAEGILSIFDAGYEALHREFARFEPDSWDTLCWHVRRGAMTAADYVELRIQELAIHDWDIRSAFDPNAGLDPESLPVLMDMSPKWLGMCFRPGPKLAQPVVFNFDVGPAAARNVWVSVQGDGFGVTSDGGPGADLAIKADTADYLLFSYGRTSAAQGLASGKLKAQGEVALLDRFEEWFKGL